MATTAKFLENSAIASGVASQSISSRPASTFLLAFMIPDASRSQPSPSLGKMMSIGAPDFLVFTARYSNDTPIGNSPWPARAHGCEPECVYSATFSCSASMNFQASASPHICSQPATSRNPVPDDAGLGMTILPLYTGLVRSFHDSGLGRFCLPASTVLKQTAAPYTSIPTHSGGFLGSRYCAGI